MRAPIARGTVESAMAVGIAALLVVGVASYHTLIFVNDTPPTGLDGGAWLALTYELFGTSVSAADVPYPPVSFVVLRGLMLLFDPLSALKADTVLAATVAVVPLFFLLKEGSSVWIAAPLTVAFALAGAHGELAAFGAYPQLIGTALLMLCLFWLNRGLRRGSRGALVLAALSAALAVGTSWRLALHIVLVTPIFAALLSLDHRVGLKPLMGRFVAWVALTGLLVLPWAPWYSSSLVGFDGSPTINARGYALTDFKDAWAVMFRDAPKLWIAATIIAYLSLLLPSRDSRSAALRPAAGALLIAPLIDFVVTKELRSLYLLEAGVVVGIGMLASNVSEQVGRRGTGMWATRSATYAVLAGVFAFSALAASSGHEYTTPLVSRYQIATPQALEAFEWLATETPPGSLVVSGTRPRGQLYGPWIEGVAKRPAYNVANPRLFRGFKEQVEQVAVAKGLLVTTREEAVRLMESHGISYFFADKRAIGVFDDFASRMNLKQEFENAHFIIWSYPEQRE